MKQSLLLRERELVVWYLLTDVSRIFRQIVDAEMRGLGLTRAQWYLLTHTYYYEGMRQQELADLMDLDKSSTARLIRKLEKKNWVRRETDATDGRASRVTLAPSLHATVRDLTRLADLNIKHAFEDLSAGELNSLVSVLRKLEANLAKKPIKPGKEAAVLRATLGASLQERPKAATAKRSKR